MPWHIAKSDSCPAAKPYAVIKNQDGSVAGCHASEGDAQQQMAALYANDEEASMPQVEQFSQVERFFLVAPFEKMDVRDASSNHNDTWTMSGYAAVFNQQATLYDSEFERLTVQIDPHAFDGVLAQQPLTRPEGVVHFNYGHDMNRAVASTDVPAGEPGSLELAPDNYGLHFMARVSRDDPDAVALAAKMRSGVIKQASFAFTSQGDQFSEMDGEDGTWEGHRRIMEVRHLYDVCATTQGVFPQTVSQLQTYARSLGQPAMGGQQRQPDLGGANVVSPDSEGDAEAELLASAILLSADETLDLIRSDPRFGGAFRK